jgi:AcrR family transcriptional regulator
LEVFWKKGYDGSGLTELTSAMGITKTSMYAAFGNKEQLFRKVVERYTAGPASYGFRALDEPTAREVAGALLHGAVRATTRSEVPSGCLGVQSALTTGDSGLPARQVLIEWRNDAVTRLAERYQRSLAEGDLPEGQNPFTLATLVMTLAYGISVQAASGRTNSELHAVVDVAMSTINWPTSAPAVNQAV